MTETQSEAVVVDEPTKAIDKEAEAEATAEAMKSTFTAEQINQMASSLRMGHRPGFRTTGARKSNLLAAIGREMRRLEKKGLNANYILKRQTDWKGTLQTPTKKLSGILSQLKEFVQD